MPKVVKRSFSLTEEQAAYIDAKVASGGYASGSELVREGLRELQQHDKAISRWLRDEVVPTLEAYEANPERARPIDEVYSELLAELGETGDERQQDRKVATRGRR